MLSDIKEYYKNVFQLQVPLEVPLGNNNDFDNNDYNNHNN